MMHLSEIEKKAFFLEVINSFASKLLKCNTIEDVLWLVARHTIGKLGYVDCVVYLYDEDTKNLIQKAAYGPKNPVSFDIENPIVLKLGEGITGSVALSGIPEIINDTSKDNRYKVDDVLRLSEIAVPIVSDEKILGVIDSEHPEINFYSKLDLEILTTISSMTASKMEQIMAINELELHKVSLQNKVNEQTILLQSQILELEKFNKRLEKEKKEKELLLKEMHHRVKNNLQIISSLLNMHSNHFNSERENNAFLDCQNRIMSMSSIHEQLYLSGNMASIDVQSYFIDLLKKLNASFSVGEEIKLNFNVQSVNFDIDVCVPLGLVVTEFYTNCLKHAFPDNSGTIEIQLITSDNNTKLTIKDNGVGFIWNDHQESLGLTIIETLIEQLEATLKFQSNENGTHVEITF